MQYTAKKPYNSVLIVSPKGLRYRFQEDHVFKDIHYAQITKVKLRYDLFRFYLLALIPLLITAHIYALMTEGFHWPYVLNLSLWALLLMYLVLTKNLYTIEIHKGPLVADVFISKNREEAKHIKKEIESHL